MMMMILMRMILPALTVVGSVAAGYGQNELHNNAQKIRFAASTGSTTAGGTTRKLKKLNKTEMALEVLGWATDAIGGKEALLAMDSLEIESAGETFIHYQWTNPSDVVITSVYEQTTAMDLVGDSIRVDEVFTPLFINVAQFPPQSSTRVVRGNIGGSSNPVIIFPGGTLPSASAASLRRQKMLFNPHLLLQMAHERPPSCLFYRRGNKRGSSVVLGIRDRCTDDVYDILLVVKKRNGRITKLRTMESSPLVRDTKITVRYKNWNLLSAEYYGLVFPRNVSLHDVNGKLWQDNRRSVRSNPVFANGTFDLPEGTDEDSFVPEQYQFGLQSHHLQEAFRYFGFPYSAFQEYPPPVELGNGVYLFPGNYNSLAILTETAGMVLQEAIGSEVVAQRFLDAARQLDPYKPVTHLLTTHVHVDHGAGCRQVIASTGAALVVGNGIKDFWLDSVFAAPSEIRPDAQAEAGNPVPAILQIPEPHGSLVVVEEPDLIITVYDVADDHTSDATVTTIETAGQIILYEADMYGAGFGFFQLPGGARDLFDGLRFHNIITENCTSPLPMTIVSAHGFPQSLEDSIAELEGVGIDIGCSQ